MNSAVERRNHHGDPYFDYPYGPDLLRPAADAGKGMWRYRSLLPIGDGPIRYPLAVGGTPLRDAPPLRDALGAPRLWLKDDTTGPSASNKDRATALVLEIGLRAGARVITTSSTGNAAVATAVGARAAGLLAVIFVAEDCAPPKVATMRDLGAHVFRVRGGYRAAFDLSRAAAARFGWLDRNTGANPATIEGKKTVAFEVAEQLPGGGPDVVVAPVGDGPTLVGLAKGFRELVACGALAGVPRVIGVQAENCAPLAEAWRQRAPIRPTRPDTIADGIAVPEPAIGAWTIDEVDHSGGAFVTVPDEALTSAMALLRATAGIAAEPAGAAGLAGLRVAWRDGLADPGETAVVLVTGRDHFAGDPAEQRGREFTIGPDLGEVERLLTAARATTRLRPHRTGAGTWIPPDHD